MTRLRPDYDGPGDGKSIYGGVKAGAVRIGQLGDRALVELLGHLGRKGKITGTAGRIWGEAMAEAVVRFMAANRKQKSGDQEQAPAGDTSALAEFINTDPDA